MTGNRGTPNSRSGDHNEMFGFLHRRKLRVENPKIWTHHRGGWTSVVTALGQHLHAPDGTRFISSIEDMLVDGEPILEPWIGFAHQAPRNGDSWFPDLERLTKHSVWLESRRYCQGIFVLSDYLKRYLVGRDPGVPVNRVYYPVAMSEECFSYRTFRASVPRRLVFIGEYLRDFHAFFELQAPGWAKCLLKPADFALQPNLMPGFGDTANGSVTVMDRLDDNAYAAVLRESVVFLALYDSPANTTVLECISSATPVLVNRLPALEEYLGKEYPLFYNDLTDAQAKLARLDLIEQGHDYLLTYGGRERLSIDQFLVALQNTAIYRSLPNPNSQALEFRRYDLTVIICSWMRVEKIPDLLRRFATQKSDKTFEIILWNNNFEAREVIDKISKEFDDHIPLTVIHSTRNFYCVIRQAVASLMRSDLLLICDDDVRPSENYVQTFFDKYVEYGPDAALCCRGHVFHPHALNEEEPHLVWQQYEHLDFYDEDCDDRQVHFMHADNCLIPRVLLLKALQYDTGPRETGLVDDYWLSFVLSHHLGVLLWKIYGGDIMEMDNSSDDPAVALFHNPAVQEQRINFYIEHMRAGWPPSAPVPRSHPAMAEPVKGNAVWDRGFCGVNISTTISEDDLSAAVDHGVRVVRIGATNGGIALRPFLDAEGRRFLWTDARRRHLLDFVDRAARHELKIILTLTHLPGRLFGGPENISDLRVWNDPFCQEELARMWATIAAELRDHDAVIGYDLINEPFLPDDIDLGLLDDDLPVNTQPLLDLYQLLINAVRAEDSSRMLIVEPHRWASPVMLPSMVPFRDPNVAYSFHMYAPYFYTNRRLNRGRTCYPGMVPEESNGRWAECRFWDRSELSRLLGGIADWQRSHNIPSSRIYVGEFGLARETRGASSYLTDLIDIFAERDWSWTIYAFREREWDAMDYELGTQISNMLSYGRSPLFDAIARHFR